MGTVLAMIIAYPTDVNSVQNSSSNLAVSSPNSATPGRRFASRGVLAAWGCGVADMQRQVRGFLTGEGQHSPILPGR